MVPRDRPFGPNRPQSSPLRWLRNNLFDGWFNSLLTLVCLWLLIQGITRFVVWIFTQAQWAVATSNLRLFFVGRYPQDQVWRLWIVLAIVVGWVGYGIWQVVGKKKVRVESLELRVKSSSISGRLPLILFPVSLVMGLWLIGGGVGLSRVPTSLWGGLMLTLLVSITSIVLAFPLGILLALGRQSSLPVLKGFCTTYIELIRGLPLIGILFMAQVMLPLVLPGQPNIDRIVRAIAGLVLFNAAYLAENVRGGLQAIPRGQTEAAKALGLNTPLTLSFIVLPQALRIAVPAIVGQFISLLKDTSLLSLFALVELTGIARSVLAQPQFLGRYAEVYLFIGLLYWIFCYTMSTISKRLEGDRSR
jgi:general L-amino acid transport system permease protein